jgi:hypothetical protein
MKSKIIGVVLCLGVILALTVVPGTPPVKVALAQSHIGVNVTPQQTSVGFSESFNVVVWIDDSLAENYDGVGIRLVYNTSYVTATGVTDAGSFDWVLDAGTINNTWNATHGLVKYDAANMAGNLSTSNPVCTVSFTSSAANTGISGLNFIYIGADAATSVTLMGGDILNWTYVVNGTVRTGMPALTVNVTPTGKGTVEADGTTLIGYPNNSTWDWDQNVTLEAVNSTPGWRFHHWSGDFDGPSDASSTYVIMDDLTKNVTANFTEAPPAILADPTSLTFRATEGEANPPNQTLDICNDGGHILNWTANITNGNVTWLSMSPMNGSNLTAAQCNSTQVAVNITGLTEGTYNAKINITGSSSVEVPVSLHIAAVPEEPEEPEEPEALPEVLPAGPAQLSASSLSITPQQVQPGRDVTISINVANTGGATGSYNAVLYINGVVEDSQSVSVAGGTSKNVIFTVSKTKAGVYDVSLAGQSGQFEVVGGGGWFGGGLGTGGIIAIVVVIIILIVAVVFILRGTARPE